MTPCRSEARISRTPVPPPPSLRVSARLAPIVLAVSLLALPAAPAGASTWGGIKALYGVDRPRPANPVLAAIADQVPEFPGWGGEITIARYDFGTLVTGAGRDGRAWAFALRDGRVVLSGNEDFWTRLHHRLQQTTCSALGAAVTLKCAGATMGVGTLGCIALGAFVAELCMEAFIQADQIDDEPDTTRVPPPDSTGSGEGGGS